MDGHWALCGILLPFVRYQQPVGTNPIYPRCNTGADMTLSRCAELGAATRPHHIQVAVTSFKMQLMNKPSSWRFRLATRIAEAYAQDPNAQVVMIAGAVGRGRDDRYSDIEVDVYYAEPPTKEDRLAAVARCGGTLELLDEDDDEWEEQMSISGLHASSSTFLVTTMERYLREVVERCELAPLAQVRLHSLQHSIPIKGAEQVEAWRAKAADYPLGLTYTMLHHNLPFKGFGYAEEMLAARDDRLLLYRLFVEVERQVIGALLSLNRLYLPTPEYMKGMDEMIAAMPLKPADLSVRLKQAFQLPPVAGVRLLKDLMVEVLALVEAQLPDFDTTSYRANLTQQRQVWDEPPPGLAL